jgi:putative ABC transport system permease protein
MTPSSLKWRIPLIAAVIGICLYYAVPPFDPDGSGPKQGKIKLGLDLQGGMHLVLRVDTASLPEKAKGDAVARAIEIIRNRIDQFGVSEPSIQAEGQDRIVVQLPGVTDRERVDETAKRITATLEREHDEKDFTVNTAENLLAQSLAILGVVQFFVLAISAISILVGGIGFTNTMFMAVSERTREIGTMKAMGATDALIRSLFLAEAAIIGLSGGILGIIVGYIAAFGIAAFASQAGFALPLTLDAGTIVFGVGFSVLIGVIAGLAPAEKAIRLDPVEAIRYE